MHTVMDETSPAHRDDKGEPRLWFPYWFFGHHAEESAEPTSAEQAEMNLRLMTMYREVMAYKKQ